MATYGLSFEKVPHAVERVAVEQIDQAVQPRRERPDGAREGEVVRGRKVPKGKERGAT